MYFQTEMRMNWPLAIQARKLFERDENLELNNLRITDKHGDGQIETYNHKKTREETFLNIKTKNYNKEIHLTE